jgi:hypothetical protein
MYWADVPAHPGLFASGPSLDELAEAMVEAWTLYSHGGASPSRPQQPARPLLSGKPNGARVNKLTLLVPAVLAQFDVGRDVDGDPADVAAAR